MMKNIFRYLISSLLFLFMGCGDSVDPQKQAELDMKLIQAIQFRDLDRVDSLLAEGASPNAEDAEGTSALLYAVNVGELELNKLLIQKGADVNKRRATSYRSTPLMEAAVRNDLAVAELLIQNGGDIHIRDTFGDPAINWAAYYGHIEYVDLLLQNGGEWDVDSKHGTALEVAMKQWNDDLVDFFISKGAGERVAFPELISAIKNNTQDKALELINEENVNAIDELGTPILVLAASKGQKELVSLLIENGVVINAMNRVGQTALSRAAYFGHQGIVEQLLDAGAAVNLSGEKYRLSPLISAANGGHARIVDLLLKEGAKVDEQDVMNGFTPLMFAVANGYSDVVRRLIKAGANPYIKTEEGAGLFDLLGYSNNTEIKDLLESYVTEN